MSTSTAPQYQGSMERPLRTKGREFDQIVDAYFARMDALPGATCTTPRKAGAEGADGWEAAVVYEAPATVYDSVNSALCEFGLDGSSITMKERAWVCSRSDGLRVETKIKAPLVTVRVMHDYTPSPSGNVVKVNTKAFVTPSKKASENFDLAFTMYRGKFETDLEGEIAAQQAREESLVQSE